MLAFGAGPAAAVTTTEITSVGPLTRVIVSDELNCQVAHQSDLVFEFYASNSTIGDCGTLLATGGTLYGPSILLAGVDAAPRTAFSVVNQSGVTGSGTTLDPYTIVTVVDAGATGLRITETDSYVVGEEAYRTDVKIDNTGSAAQSAILYRAGDCYLGGSDVGFGFVDGGKVACSKTADNVPVDRVEQWIPISSGSSYYQAAFYEVWSWIGTQQPFPNTCECASEQDNGAGLSWSLSVPAGGTVTRSHLTSFSPVGNVPLTTAKSADTATSTPGGANGYTITVSNPNASAVTLSSIIDTLPAGFTYTTGTTTDGTTADPDVVGQTLTWPGPFPVAGGGSVSIHFGVTAASTPGVYSNEATASAPSPYSVTPTGPTAEITVTGQAPVVQAGDDVSGNEGSAIGLTGSVTDGDSPGVTSTWTYAAIGADAGATCSFADASSAVTTMTCTDDGTYTATLTADDGDFPPVSDSVDVTVANLAPTVSITAPADGTLAAINTNINLSAAFADAGINDTHTCTLNLDNGTPVAAGSVVEAAGAGTCTKALSYAAAGVYTVTVTVTDDDGAFNSDSVMIVVYDPSSGFVTGGGWIDSPAGAYVADPTSSGRANFGFVSKYRRGISTPTGRTEFQYSTAGFNFHSESYSWLVVSGPKAQFKGTGTVNGTSGYGFLLTVTDGQVAGGGGLDKFRIKVWELASGNVVYDNVVGAPDDLFAANPQVIGAGNIVIHR